MTVRLRCLVCYVVVMQCLVCDELTIKCSSLDCTGPGLSMRGRPTVTTKAQAQAETKAQPETEADIVWVVSLYW